ncbi:hypothetical protein CKO44_17655 [Rubrivivax gelatinosus]|uniref:Transmembrane protein n=1 Tax=Rubrivivax gelatinosus TaxID=28068 RepID=A0ABS1E174_RUBGE|nr:hypothetical protein [Rubrivivax gelatinosus]MBK1615289.1 hypothetical protein [Rubrivivax gelatinosus]MBK1715488.1 hypothetical protein [Rubrivivax gelatinosus]
MIAAIWIVTALLLGLWSLGAWGVYTLLQAQPGWIGELGELVDQVPYAAVIDRWFPGWQELLRALLELTESTLGLLGGAAPLIVWTAWGVGAAGLAVAAGGLTLIVKLLSRDKPRAAA